MKKIVLFVLMVVTVLAAGAASSRTKIYINPGHGGHDSNDRPTPLPTELGYTTSQQFYESDGTLDRGLTLDTLMRGMGFQTKMSRKTNTSADDLSLSTIAAQSNSYGGYFVSLHSNGANASANYVVAMYSGTRTTNSTERVSGSQAFAAECAKQSDINRLTDVTYSTPRAVNDYAFQGWSLGVLSSNTQVGYLVETWFHDYRPEALRMKSHVYNKFTAWQIARAYVNNPGGNTSVLKGCIIGDIRDLSKSCGYSSYTSRNRDSKMAVNGAKVELLNSSGTVVQTMTTDNWSNGVYGFFELAAGSYTVRVSKTGYKSQTATVTVSNNTSTLKRFDLTQGTDNGIGTSASSINFGSVTVGSTLSKTVTVTGAGLTAGITVQSNNGLYTVTPTSLPATGGTLTVKYAPTAAGNHSGTITLTSGTKTATVALDGTAKNPPLAFTEGWNMSETSGKKDSKWLSTYGKARNMDFGAGKLYVVNAEDGKIAVVNAQTGAYIKDLNMTGVSEGTLKVIDVKYFDGKVLACNLAAPTSDASKPLKVYIWDNDNAAPRVLLNTTDYDNKARVGDCLGVFGTLNDGYIYFAAGSQTEQNEVLRYRIKNGVCATTPDYIMPLSEQGNSVTLGLSPRVYPEAPACFWAIGQQRYPTFFNDGVVQYTHNSGALGGVIHGNAFKPFTYRGTTYGLSTTYQAGSTTLTGGHVVLTDGTNGWAMSEALGSYPSAGLGTTRNTSMSTSVATAVNGDQGVEMWVLVHNQGIAYYKTGVVPTYDLNDTIARVTVSADKIAMDNIECGMTGQATINVTGSNLKDDIKISVTGANANLFSVSPSTIARTTASGNVTVDYKPQALGTHSASLVISSTGVKDIIIPITATCVEEPTVKGNFQKLNNLWYYHIPSGSHANENLVVLSNATEQHGHAIPDPMLQQYLVSRGQVWFWNYTDQKTNGKATTANIGTDGRIVAPDGCYAIMFQNSVENETEGTGYAASNVIDFSNMGAYGTASATAFNGVADLTGLGYFKNITTLNMSRAQYASLSSHSALTCVNLAGNTKLTRVDLTGNDLVTLDITANAALQELVLAGNASFSKLVSGTNANMQIIDLSGTAYDNALQSDVVAKFGNLRVLHAAGTLVSDIDVTRLAKLQSLDLHNDAAGTARVHVLDLSNNTALRNLHLSNLHLAALNINSSTLGQSFVSFGGKAEASAVDVAGNSRCGKANFVTWNTIEGGKTKYHAMCYLPIAGDDVNLLDTQKGWFDVTNNGKLETVNLTSTMADDGFSADKVALWHLATASHATTGSTLQVLDGDQLKETGITGTVVVLKCYDSDTAISDVPTDAPIAVAYDYTIASGRTATFYLDIKQYTHVESFLPGDVNEDGVVDVIDVSAVVNKLLGYEPVPFNTKAADMNADGRYDILDINSIISKILAGE